jgi:hypothetical protein
MSKQAAKHDKFAYAEDLVNKGEVSVLPTCLVPEHVDKKLFHWRPFPDPDKE